MSTAYPEEISDSQRVSQAPLRKASYVIHSCLSPELVIDAGVSAKSLDRPGLGGVLAEVRRKRVDALLVLKPDRLIRSMADLATLVKRDCKVVLECGERRIAGTSWFLP